MINERDIDEKEFEEFEEPENNIPKESRGGLSSNPTVLSCGGIYIPHQGNAQRMIYHIITTSNKDTPVKVVTGTKPRNILHEILQKESMN